MMKEYETRDRKLSQKDKMYTLESLNTGLLPWQAMTAISFDRCPSTSQTTGRKIYVPGQEQCVGWAMKGRRSMRSRRKTHSTRRNRNV